MPTALSSFDRAVAQLPPNRSLDACLARLQHWACMLPVLAGRPSRYGSGWHARRAAENAGRAAGYALRAGLRGDDATDPELWRELHAIVMSGLLPPNRCGRFRDGNMLLLEPDGRRWRVPCRRPGSARP